jgi:hypothetical protein
VLSVLSVPNNQSGPKIKDPWSVVLSGITHGVRLCNERSVCTNWNGRSICESRLSTITREPLARFISIICPEISLLRVQNMPRKMCSVYKVSRIQGGLEIPICTSSTPPVKMLLWQQISLLEVSKAAISLSVSGLGTSSPAYLVSYPTRMTRLFLSFLDI